MEKERKIEITPGGQAPANLYDDGNIPKEDLPKGIIPDEVPRKDGPGGEIGEYPSPRTYPCFEDYVFIFEGTASSTTALIPFPALFNLFMAKANEKVTKRILYFSR